MFLVDYMNARVKQFTIYDIKLIQGAAICAVLVLVKLVPEILNINIWWFATFAILFAIRPAYMLFFKRGLSK